MLDDLAPVVGMRREERDHAVERRGDRVEAADEEQVAHPEQLALAQRLAVDLPLHDLRQQPVVRIGAPLGDRHPEVVADLGRGLPPDPFGPAEVAGRDVGAHHLVAPLQEEGQVFARAVP